MNEPLDSKSRVHALMGLLRAGRLRAVIAVRGDSMLPTLASQRRVEVRFGETSPRIGDLIVFRQADYLAVHRCLGRNETAGRIHLRTRGDGRTDCDAPVDFTDVLGVVASLERPDGWRTTGGSGARVYAVLVALHARFWAETGAVASRLGRVTGLGWVRPAVESADRLSLRLADTMLFRALHRRAAAPAGEAGGVE